MGTRGGGPLSSLAEVRKLTEEFLGALAVQGYSPNTLRNYQRFLKTFTERVNIENKNPFCPDRKDPTFVDHAFLLRWLQAIRMTGVKECVLQSNKSAISSWYEWLIRVGKVERNPVDMLAPIKVPETDPKPLSVADTQLVLEGIGQMTWRDPERNHAILELFYASGLRLNELRHLDIDDLRINDPRPHVIVRQGKGKRDGIGMLTPPAVQALKAYLPKRARLVRKWEKGQDWKPLFLSRTGDRLCEWRIWNMVVQIGLKVLGRRIHPHQFRHSFCTDLLNSGADLESIRKLARHKKLTTTQKYLNVSTEHLMEAYEKHPRMRPKS